MAECKGKRSWPELVGSNGQDAATTIEEENCSVKAIVVTEGTIVDHLFRCDRVRVWVDEYEVVTRVPSIG
ncbi:hypothetical protein AMTRI_Chr03g54080 [Amborella trichopoda]